MKRKDFSGITSQLEQAIAAPAPSRRAAHLRSIQMQIDAISGDLDTVLALARPDVTLDIFAPQEFPWIRRARGVAERRNAIQHNFDTVGDQRPEITNILAEGDAVVVFGGERGTIRQDACCNDVEFVQRFTFRDERLASVRIIVAHAVSGTGQGAPGS